MGQVSIPTRLSALLDASNLGVEVKRLVSLLSRDFIQPTNAELFFFPEYTDHGDVHISQVLHAAEQLISVRSWPIIHPDDGAVLVLATVFHDLAMSLTQDAFFTVLNDKYWPVPPARLVGSTMRWKDLLDEYITDAKRWDERKLLAIVGEQRRRNRRKVGTLSACIRHPDHVDPNEWGYRYRRFIGEFVRRHHGRLALEFLVNGIPGRGGIAISARDFSIRDDLRIIAGLVARSHSQTLRDAIAVIELNFSGRRTTVGAGGVHSTFLMALLRIADYLQVDSTRSNVGRLAVQGLRNPVSLEEHQSHRAIESVHVKETDPEAVHVIAKPANLASFIKVRCLLTGLQRELDLSWAVLGEVYGLQPTMCDLGLTLRRVFTTLDDAEELATNCCDLPYYPIEARFDAAGGQVLKLLVRPLYGNKPTYGVRELIQNSVDAVRELDRWRQNSAGSTSASLSSRSPDVIVAIELREKRGKKYSVLRITDRGIGMKPETVRDYFLRAGATYRRSEQWKSKFESYGRSTVMRSGRFGIGALAAFLLGKRFSVVTRHVEAAEDEAVEFTASLNDEVVELRRAKKAQPGTTIEIRLFSAAAQTLRRCAAASFSDLESNEDFWDWYTLAFPRVVRTVDGVEMQAGDPMELDERGNNSEYGWGVFRTKVFPAIYWAFNRSLTSLTVNGLAVAAGACARWCRRRGDFPIQIPSLAVFDPDAAMPLTLTRDSFDGPLPFDKELSTEMMREMLAYLLVRGPTNFFSACTMFCESENIEMFNDSEFQGFQNILCARTSGFGWGHWKHQIKSGIRRGITIFAHARGARQLVDYFEGAGADAVTVSDAREPFGTFTRYRRPIALFKQQGTFVDETRKLEFYCTDVILRYSGFCIGGRTAKDYILHPSERLAESAKAAKCSAIVEWETPSAYIPHAGTSRFLNMWNEIIGAPEIPYDPAARLSALGKAYDALACYVAYWTGKVEPGWRKGMPGWKSPPTAPRTYL